MVYSNNFNYKAAKEEHAYKIIQKDLKGDNLPSVILLFGKEQFLVEWARKQIVGKYVNSASSVLDLTIIDEEDTITNIVETIIESCETLPLLSTKKVVIVNNTQLLKSSEKQDSKSSELNRLCDYLTNIPDSTCLIFVSDSVDKKRKLPKAIQKNGKLYDFNQLDRKELISFAEKRFKGAGIKVPSRTMDYLIDTTGYFNKESDYDLYTFSNDITKMIALAEDGLLRDSDIKDTVESDVETFIFTLMNSISEGRKDKAFSMLHNIVSDRNDVSGIVAMIVGQFEIMYSIKELLNDGAPDRIIVEKLNIKEARLRILKPFISKYSLPELKRALISAYEIDRNIKTGLLTPLLALEVFVSKL